MRLSNLRRYLADKEKRHPRLVGSLRRFNRRLQRLQGPTHPAILRNEIAAVSEVLKSPFWNLNYGGNLVHETLEQEFAEYVGAHHAVAVSTGGMAIQMCLRAFGLKPGDEVLHQIDTCVADAFAVFAAGATPIFADINRENFMLAQTSAADEISPATKAIMPVHMWGNPENMDWISGLAKKNALYVIEDACLALGAELKGKRVGSFGDAAVFSFGCLKPIQAGEGGIITTNDESLAKELRTIRNWGDMSKEYGVRDQRTLSWNGRISEIVAAVGLEQLRGYPQYLEKLRDLVNEFTRRLEKFENLEIAVPESGELKPAYSQVVVRLNKSGVGILKSDLMSRLNEQGIPVWHANFEPINQLSFFREDHWQDWIIRGDLDRVRRNYHRVFANSEEVYANSGLGFSRDNFSSKERVLRLVRALERALRKG